MDKIALKQPGKAETTEVILRLEGDKLVIEYDGRSFESRIVSREAGEGILEHDGKLLPYYYCWLKTAGGERQLQVWVGGCVYTLEAVETGARRGRGAGAAAAASGDIKAPMPGKILQLKVSEGDNVVADQTVVVMESMKMEMTLTAPTAGTVKSIDCRPGDMVEMGSLLVKLESDNHA